MHFVDKRIRKLLPAQEGALCIWLKRLLVVGPAGHQLLVLSEGPVLLPGSNGVLEHIGQVEARGSVLYLQAPALHGFLVHHYAIVVVEEYSGLLGCVDVALDDPIAFGGYPAGYFRFWCLGRSGKGN
jgi:hypothetical protein